MWALERESELVSVNLSVREGERRRKRKTDDVFVYVKREKLSLCVLV